MGRHAVGGIMPTLISPIVRLAVENLGHGTLRKPSSRQVGRCPFWPPALERGWSGGQPHTFLRSSWNLKVPSGLHVDVILSYHSLASCLIGITRARKRLR